jgi:hypothetical protein
MSMMVYLNVLDGELPYPLVAVIILTGVIAALCVAGIQACRGIKGWLRERDK